ncbi:F-box protein [Sporobolomyces salmoneus]|uniref:F-box protein n=1 Tax=Sporobolomyces salmoneus TaxID=183962 RepID=UPI00317E8915
MASRPRPASSSLSPEPRNFARLPPELLQSIFDYLSPYPILPSQYKERQALFRSISLVNKQLNRLAKWYLLHVVKLSIVGHRSLSGVASILRKLRKGDLGEANKVKCLICEDLEYKHKVGIEGVKGLTEKLEEISYKAKTEGGARFGQTPKPSRIGYYCFMPFLGSNLKRLHLVNIDIYETQSFDFPLLQQLSFDNVLLPHESTFTYNLPSLRHFSTSQNRKEFYLLEALLPQLVSFGVHLEERSTLPKSILKSTVPCLVRCSVNTPRGDLTFRTQHMEIFNLRLEGSEGSRGSNSYLLSRWINALAGLHEPISLRSISISDKMHWHQKSLTVDQRRNVLDFEQTCRSKGIELIYEETDEDMNDQGRLSREFIRRAETGRT